eukprot:TRINITY_DN35281_c0_g1_i1.p1 TRINITY_DN35281_c0_g1~~TRINITY_DN35281_c0_g1_i1.p1  ORF type:complete len:602 (+),score=13.23 TRINITY_DN35281_c0_g1_i1:77-1882(+)
MTATLTDIEDLVVEFNQTTPRRTQPFDPENYEPAKQHPLTTWAHTLNKSTGEWMTADSAPLGVASDVLLVVLEYCGASCVTICMTLNKWWFVSCMESKLWSQMFLNDFGDDPDGHHSNLAKHFLKRHFYLIYKRSFKRTPKYIPMRTSDSESFSSHLQSPILAPLYDIELKWRYRCPLSWFDLDPISATERHCSACGKNVKKITTAELRTLRTAPSCVLVVAAGPDVGSVERDLPTSDNSDTYSDCVMGYIESDPFPDSPESEDSFSFSDGLSSLGSDLFPDYSVEDCFPPSRGKSYAEKWTQRSDLPVDYVAAGLFAEAMQILRRQCGIISFMPLQPYFINIWTSVTATLPVGPLLPPQLVHINRPADGAAPVVRGRPVPLPATMYSYRYLVEQMKAGYKATTDGQFVEAVDIFRHLMRSCIFVVGDKRTNTEVTECVHIGGAYVAALRMELTRKGTEDVNRNLELAAYFANAELQPAHKSRTLQLAMAVAYRNGNFKSAAGFAKRLLGMSPPSKTARQASKVIQIGEQKDTDAHVIDYDVTQRFIVCAGNLKPIYKGQEYKRCTFCSQPYTTEFQSTVCLVCEMGEVGGDATGFKNFYS